MINLSWRCRTTTCRTTPQVWEYTVLATNATYDIAAIGQLYRDRCDCENGFDELKNQWGWGGFRTQDMHRSQVTARAVALVYNWWSWYVRAANPQARREALTSRPLLLAAVGRAAKQRQPDHAVPHADARRIGLDQVDDRQCPCGHPARQGL